MTFPQIRGVCPACHRGTLFLGSGGHVTCSLIGCPDPCAADRLLHERPLTTYCRGCKSAPGEPCQCPPPVVSGGPT